MVPHSYMPDMMDCMSYFRSIYFMRLRLVGTKHLSLLIHLDSNSSRMPRLDLEYGWPLAKLCTFTLRDFTFMASFIEMPANYINVSVLVNVLDMYP